MPSYVGEERPGALQEAEDGMVQTRRAAVRPHGVNPPLPGKIGDAESVDSQWGLALSGGGIRSATFCLGVLQSLASKQTLPRFDFLSTVSGGGFIGAFLGAAIQRRGIRQTCGELSDSRSRTIRWFRENGRYLAPNGVADFWGAGAAMIRNWLSVHVVVAGSLLFLMLAAQCLRAVAIRYAGSLWAPFEPVPGGVAGFELLPSPWFWLAAVIFGAWFAPSAWAYWLTQRARGWIPPFIGCLLGLLYAAAVLSLPTDVEPGRMVAAYRAIAGGFAGLAVLTFVAWVGATWWMLDDPEVDAEVRARVKRGAVLLIVALVVGVGAQLLRPGLRLEVWVAGLSVAGLLAVGAGAGVARVIEADEARTLRRLVRAWLSRSAASALILLGLSLLMGVMDTLAQSAYQGIVFAALVGSGLWGAMVSAAGALFPVGSAIVPWLHRILGFLGAKPRASLGFVSAAAAMLLVGLYLSGLSVLAYAIRQGGAPLGSAPAPWTWPLVCLGALLLLSIVVSRLFGFVNSSSLHDYYVARLNRTYIGASSEERLKQVLPPTEPERRDDMELSEYTPYDRGGPLHIINVTLNETVSGRSHTEQEDRRGLPLAVGPAALTVGTRRHAQWDEDRKVVTSLEPDKRADGEPAYQLWPGGRQLTPERLSLGYWTGISGAAFSTGVGYRTSLATSLLAGLFNVRLGFWWDSGVHPAERHGEVPLTTGGKFARMLERFCPVQVALLDEFMGRFHGPARKRWYLSDGGHFENTACYELIRRRLPVIVVCDCGADPDYHFEDLGKLVRLARSDFGAEIRFLDADQLKALFAAAAPIGVGSLADLVPAAPAGDGPRLAKAHLAVAQVTYPPRPGVGREVSVLLLVKPTLGPDVSLDLVEYHFRQRRFPQQPTTDQFFDENQWECYRQLGCEIGGMAAGFLQSDAMDKVRAWTPPGMLSPAGSTPGSSSGAAP